MSLVALEKPLKVRLLRLLKPRTAKISVRKLEVPIKLDQLLILSRKDFYLKKYIASTIAIHLSKEEDIQPKMGDSGNIRAALVPVTAGRERRPDLTVDDHCVGSIPNHRFQPCPGPAKSGYLGAWLWNLHFHQLLK